MKKHRKIRKILTIVIILLIVLFGIFKISDLIYQSKYPVTYSEDTYTILSETPGWVCNDTYGCEYQSDDFLIRQSNNIFTLISSDYSGPFFVFSYWHSRNSVTANKDGIAFDSCSFNVLGFLECEEKTYRMTYNDQILVRKMKKIIDDALEDYIVK